MSAVTSPLQALVEVAEAAESFSIQTEFDLPDGATLTYFLNCYNTNGRWVGYGNLRATRGRKVSWPGMPSFTKLDQAYRGLAAAYPQAVLRPESVEVKINKGTTTPAKVRPVAIQAWHEAFGRPIPTLDEIAAERKAAKAAEQSASQETVALLRTGKEGVDKFNRRPAHRRAKADMHKADLAGADLEGIDLTQVRLHEAKLTGARLAGATFAGTKCGDADLSGAPTPHRARKALGRPSARGRTSPGPTWSDADLSSCSN